MPMVGKMKFAYTEKGKKEAKSYAKKTGKAMTAKPMKKAAIRTWLNGMSKDYPLALTLTLKQAIVETTDRGT